MSYLHTTLNLSLKHLNNTLNMSYLCIRTAFFNMCVTRNPFGGPILGTMQSGIYIMIPNSRKITVMKCQ